MLDHIPPSVHDRHPKLATLFTDMLCTDADKKPSLENILLHDFFSGVALKEKATEDVASALAERDETRELAAAQIATVTAEYDQVCVSAEHVQP